jgi:glycosyltransferase involved in cell wall biosynthesis
MSQLVSILICVNRIDHFFSRAITSIRRQSYENFEIVLVGNTLSQQDQILVEDLARSDPKVRLFLTSVKYLTFSLNLGLHHCRGGLVARMDADDIAYPDRIAKQVSFMESHLDVDICGTSYNLIDDDDRIIGTRALPRTHAAIKRALFLGNPFAHPSVMFKRDTVRRMGGYMGGLYAEDYDLWCRMATDNSIKFANLAEKLLGYRVAPTGLARRSKVAYAGVSAAQWRNFVVSGDPRWLFGTVVSFAKRLLRANQ